MLAVARRGQQRIVLLVGRRGRWRRKGYLLLEEGERSCCLLEKKENAGREEGEGEGGRRGIGEKGSARGRVLACVACSGW